MRRFKDFSWKLEEQEDAETETGSDLDFDLEMEEPKGLIPSKTEVGASIDDSFRKLVEFQVQLRLFHWGTDSFSQHEGAGTTYKSIDETLDTLVESYQGYTGRLKMGGQITLLNYEDVNTDEWLGSIIDLIGEMRTQINQSDVQNVLDEFLGSVSKFKYLLSLK